MSGPRLVVVDQRACRGTGLCVAMAPELFRLDDDGSATSDAVVRDGDDADLADEVVDCCPTGAVRLDDAPADDEDTSRRPERLRSSP